MGTKFKRFRGVRQRQWGSWVSEIQHPITKIRVWLGSFQSAEEAALAYDEAARFISGPNAKTNFPYGINCNSTSSSGKKPLHCRLSPALREKLRRCCYMELSPSKHYLSKQSSCRNMTDSSRSYVHFSCWNSLSGTDNSTSEETEELPQVVASDEEANEIRSSGTKTISDQVQLVPNHPDSPTANDSELDDYSGAEMIKELLNCSFSFDLEFESAGL